MEHFIHVASQIILTYDKILCMYIVVTDLYKYHLA